jgi:hypothetical protein
MRSSTIRAILCLAVLVFISGGPTAFAENEDSLRFSHIERARRAVPMPLVKPVPVAPRTAPAATAGAEAPKPKVEPTIFVSVIGDSLGELLGQGIDDALADIPEVAVGRRARGDTGLVRADFFDWPRVVTEMLATDRITFGVVMIGVNDRQSIREGDVSHDPFSERWREIYAQRVDAIVAAFAEKKVPLFWVGLPPMRSERLSADMLALNEIARGRVQRAGATFIDIWEAFVDVENRFTITGPDVNGQQARIRTSDGVHFTKAGARKAAHFVDVELRRLIQSQSGNAVAVIPPDAGMLSPDLQPGGVERMIDAAMTHLPELPGMPVIPMKPVAGPVLSLTRAELSAGGLLIERRQTLAPADAVAERVLVEGRPPEPVRGRADDFRWVRPN